MNEQHAGNYCHTPISTGPDWITATAKIGAPSLSFEEIADDYLQRKRDAGGAIHSASRLGYRGYSTDHFYFGRRSEDVLLIVSSHDAIVLAKSIIDVASNVSRLDLQVTVWTHGEQCNLAVENYRRLCGARRLRHRPGQISLTTTKPSGDSLNVNKRSSDSYGRLYCKGSEAKAAPPHTLWRYEVEYKRRAAADHAMALARASSIPNFTRNKVHSWWEARGVNCSFSPAEGSLLELQPLPLPTRNVLSWFESSVSITVARAIKSYGLEATIRSLGLEALVEPIRKEVDQFHGSRLGSISSEADRDASLADHTDRLLVHDDWTN